TLLFSDFAPANGLLLATEEWSYEVGTSAVDGTFALADRVPPCAADWPHTLMAVSDDGLGWTALWIVGGRAERRDVAIAVTSGGPLDVTVVDAARQPVRDATVSLEPRYSPFWRDGASRHSTWFGRRARVAGLFQAQVDESGHARFAHLPAGRHDVIARAKG